MPETHSAIAETTMLLDAMAWGHEIRESIIREEGTSGLDQIAALMRDHALVGGVDLTDARTVGIGLVMLQLLAERGEAYGLGEDFETLIAEAAGVLSETGGL